MLFRCWLGSWAAFVLLLPDKTLKTMGNACVSYSLPGDFPTVSMNLSMGGDGVIYIASLALLL